MNRRLFFQAALGGAASALLFRDGVSAIPLLPVQMTIYKTPTCGCCSAWVEHIKDNGFTVKIFDYDDLTDIKNRFGVPTQLTSCHTALVNNYLVEGHVPADLIKKMMSEKPKILGIAVPGMPSGSPGMETPGRPADKYDVIAFTREGRMSVYARR